MSESFLLDWWPPRPSEIACSRRYRMRTEQILRTSLRKGRPNILWHISNFFDNQPANVRQPIISNEIRGLDLASYRCLTQGSLLGRPARLCFFNVCQIHSLTFYAADPSSGAIRDQVMASERRSVATQLTDRPPSRENFKAIQEPSQRNEGSSNGRSWPIILVHERRVVLTLMPQRPTCGRRPSALWSIAKTSKQGAIRPC